MSIMEFRDLDFEFSHKNLSQENYLKLKDKLFSSYQALCSKHQSISDYGIIYEWVSFNDENKSIGIIIPRNWQQNELFVMFILQKKAFSVLDLPGFNHHLPSHLNDFSPEAKDDFFKFCNQLLKEIDGKFYANWQVFNEGMYWNCGIDVNHNNDGDYVKVDYRQDAYDKKDEDAMEEVEKISEEEMTEDQKSQLNELLEAVKKGTNNSIEISYDGTVAGIESVKYEKGDDYITYNRNFEYYSHTCQVDLTNEEILDIINISLENNDYSAFVEGLVDESEFLNADSYEYDNYDLEFSSIDDDEIPKELLDEDGGIDLLKLDDNGWSFEILDQEEEFDESEITEISISVGDKQFTF